MEESSRRRNKQLAHNKKHGIIPKTVIRKIGEPISVYDKEGKYKSYTIEEPKVPYFEDSGKEIIAGERDINDIIKRMEKEMKKAAKNLEFEKAARLRDKITALRSGLL